MNARLMATLLAPGTFIPVSRRRQWVGPWLRRAWWYSGAGPSALDSHRFPGVLVLAYHGIRSSAAPDSRLTFAPLHVPDAAFAAHCAFFQRYCEVLSADEWLAVQRHERPLPARGVLLTFDDGYRSVLTSAVPILRTHNLPALFFVCSGPARAKELHWYDALARRDGEDAVRLLRDGTFDRWQQTVAMLDRACGVSDPQAVMTPEDIAALASTPGMTVGAHTVSHPPLARASADRQAKEMEDCARDLSEWTQRQIRFFAYPTGRRPADYDNTSVSAADRAGFVSAFTTADGFASPDRPPLEQPRYTVVDGLTVPELAYRLVYVWK